MSAFHKSKVSHTFITGVTPAGSAVTPNGKFLYVANNNNYDIPDNYSVSVFNIRTKMLVATIKDESFNQPYTITINKSGKIAYVTNSNTPLKKNFPGTITKINIRKNKVIGVIGDLTPSEGGLDGPSGMVIMDNLAYVNNYGGPGGVSSGNGSTVSVINLNTDKIIDTINVGLAPAAIDISPNGKYLYVANYVDGNNGTGTISVIKTKNNKLKSLIKGLSGPFAISVTPNGKRLYVTNFGSNNFRPTGNTVSIIDTSCNSIIKTITVGIQPSGLAITPDGLYALVSNYNTLYAEFIPPFTYNNLTPGQGTVNIIDVKCEELTSSVITVGQSPSNISISPDGKYAFVSNFIGNTVSVISIL